MSDTDYLWLEGNEALNKLCHQLATRSWVVLDTEFFRERTYYPVTGLLQFSDGSQTYLVDPETINDWTALGNLLKSDLLWIMHACSEDLDVLHRLTGNVPANLFDSQVASGFAGLGASLGYAGLIKALSGNEINKGQSRSDWLARPLSSEQITYAVLDVYLLAQHWDKLRIKLEECQLMDAFKQDMQVLSAWSPQNEQQAYLKIKQAWTLKQPIQIARLQALAEWRELTARELDRVKKHIMEDEVLIELSKIELSKIDHDLDLTDLKRSNLLNGHKLKRYGKQLIEVIGSVELEKSTAQTPINLNEIPQARKLLKAWKKQAQAVAERENIPAPMLFNQRLLQSYFKFKMGLLQHPSSMWTDWRKKLLEPVLQL